MASFTKSVGLTASERHLAQLSERSFLSLWSYPNVFRKQGKELCDVLVVFREHIIIFSDKSCRFPNTGDLGLDWPRWFNRAILKSADQIHRAERWLREHPDRVFLDSACKQRFPIALPEMKEARIHRVVVASNVSERCKLHFANKGSGSLVLRPDIVGRQAHEDAPFTVGHIVANRGYIHVLDDVTLDIVLRELDTVIDFTNYLTSKEAAIQSAKVFAAAGEEELLANYLTNVNAAGLHDIVSPDDTNEVLFAEGSWASLAKNPRYVAKKQADRSSYAWDELIEKFSKHLTTGTLATGNELPLAAYERGVRIMAGESRFQRRGLVSAFFNLLQNALSKGDATRLVVRDETPERAYQFIVSPMRNGQSFEVYREQRAALLSAYCHVAKLKFPNLLDIIGIATESLDATGRSEDLMYLDARLWSAEDEARTRDLQAKTGIMLNPTRTPFHDDEYPDNAAVLKKTPALPITLDGNRKQRRARAAELRRANKYRRTEA